MTAEQRRTFLTRLAADYDWTAAVRCAKITAADARSLLHTDADALDFLDHAVARRVNGAALSRITGEYEKIAFGDSEEYKPADRIRALEQLRLIASSGERDGGAPALTIRCEYV